MEAIKLLRDLGSASPNPSSNNSCSAISSIKLGVVCSSKSSSINVSSLNSLDKSF